VVENYDGNIRQLNQLLVLEFYNPSLFPNLPFFVSTLPYAPQIVLSVPKQATGLSRPLKSTVQNISIGVWKEDTHTFGHNSDNTNFLIPWEVGL